LLLAIKQKAKKPAIMGSIRKEPKNRPAKKEGINRKRFFAQSPGLSRLK
jgi:hypothetical protein